jgi:hypothetical protein
MPIHYSQRTIRLIVGDIFFRDQSLEAKELFDRLEAKLNGPDPLVSVAEYYDVAQELLSKDPSDWFIIRYLGDILSRLRVVLQDAGEGIGNFNTAAFIQSCASYNPNVTWCYKLPAMQRWQTLEDCLGDVKKAMDLYNQVEAFLLGKNPEFPSKEAFFEEARRILASIEC